MTENQADLTKPYIRLNAKVGREPMVSEFYTERSTAAEAFRRYAAEPDLSMVEVWDCEPSPDSPRCGSAVELWKFIPA